MCARVGGLVLRARPKTRNREPCEPLPSASTACGFGAQAFYVASAFNADIGAWNTARVSDMAYVCAAPGPAARTMADALGRASNAALPVVRGGTADARARAHVSALALRGAIGVGTAVRRGGSVHASVYTYMCACVRACVARLHMHYPFICICENRPG